MKTAARRKPSLVSAAIAALAPAGTYPYRAFRAPFGLLRRSSALLPPLPANPGSGVLMQGQPILSLPFQKWRGAFHGYKSLVLATFFLFAAFRAQRIWFNAAGGFLDLLYGGAFIILALFLWARRSWLSFTSLSILLGSLLAFVYAGSPLVFFWYTIIGAGFVLSLIELTRERMLWRWLSRTKQEKRLSLWPIEGSDGEGLPRVFSWQTDLNAGVLHQKVHHGDNYRGGTQRIPLAKAPLDFAYIKRVINERTALVAVLLLAPLSGVYDWYTTSNYWVAPNPTDVAIKDIDGDQDLDLLTSNLGATPASILLNDGTGRFAWYIGVRDADVATRVGVTNHQELVLQSTDTLKRSTKTTTIDLSELDSLIDRMGYSLQARVNAATSWAPSNHTNLVPSKELAAEGSQSWQAFSDLDLDGFQDVVTITSEGVKVIFGADRKKNSPTESTLAHPVRSDYRVNNIAIADLNQNGSPEIIVSAPEYYQILAYEVRGREISEPRSLLELFELSSFALGDVNADGWLDLVIIKGVSQSIEVYTNQRGAFTLFSTIGENPQNIRATAPRVALGDLDGDGDLDLATTDFVRDQVRVFFNNGTGTFSQR